MAVKRFSGKRKGMRLGVFGSRSLYGGEVARLLRQEIEQTAAVEIVTAAEIEGVSMMARQLAAQLELALLVFYPKKSLYHDGAYEERSIAIMDACDKLIVVWDGKSSGTKRELELCKRSGKVYVLYLVSRDDTPVDNTMALLAMAEENLNVRP